jgi:hypothetical protein
VKSCEETKIRQNADAWTCDDLHKRARTNPEGWSNGLVSRQARQIKFLGLRNSASLIRGAAPETPRFIALGPESLCYIGADYTAPAIPASGSTLGSHLCVALSSAQTFSEWKTSTQPCNNFSLNGRYPLNLLSHSKGSLQSNAGLDDTWQKVDYENMAKVDRAVALATLNMANSLKAPQWNVSNLKTAAFRESRERSLRNNNRENGRHR